MSTTNTASPVSLAAPHKGLPLGLRLAIYTAAIVAAVMGSVTIYQETRNTRYEHEQIVAALYSSLLPLAARVEDASSLAAAVRELDEFHESYLRGGTTGHFFAMREGDAQEIAGTLPAGSNLDDFARADLVVANTVFQDGTVTLSAYQEKTAFRDHVRRRWIRGILHFVATLGAILVALQVAIRLLVTAPLERLLDGIRKTEMGYWGDVASTGGAWELQFVIWRFHSMGRELENTVQRLLAAQRRAKEPAEPKARPASTAGVDAARSQRLNSEARTAENSLAERSLSELCDRLERVSTPSAADRALARATAARHAFEAEALGDMPLKSRLENASLRILQPGTYRKLNAQLADYSDKRSAALEQCRERLRHLLEESLIPVVDLQARHKHLAGVYAKMQAKGLDFRQIHDLFALRVVVPSEPDCYRTLGLVHETFTPIVGRFKDYIAAPKPNGYQSLHTCVRIQDDLVVEIQIRSSSMHRSAEDGAASHLGYKQSNTEYKKPVTASVTLGRRLGKLMRGLL